MVAVNTRKIKRKLNLQNKFYLYVPTSFSFLSLSLSLSLSFTILSKCLPTRIESNREEKMKVKLVWWRFMESFKVYEF